MILDIVTFPDETLRAKTHDVPPGPLSKSNRQLVMDMIETMHAHDALGLAAIQVGRLERIIVVDMVKIAGRSMSPLSGIIINPRIVKLDGDVMAFQEGCLSFPDRVVSVRRPSRIVMKAKDMGMRDIRITADGDLLSRVLQHEHDHLENRLMIDYLEDAGNVASFSSSRNEQDKIL